MNELSPLSNLITSEEDAEKVMRWVFEDENLYSREGIQELSDYMCNLPNAMGKDPFPLFHSFSDGLYSREIHIPKGHSIVGAIHKKESMVYLIKGHILVVDENGLKELKAPAHFISTAGLKRIAYVIDDVVWLDIHHTEHTEIDNAEKELFTESYDEYDEYINAIGELGYTEKEVRAISEHKDDMIDLTDERKSNVSIKASTIEGLGVFSLKNLIDGDIIGEARIGKCRTPLGRYTNHSNRPNAEFRLENDSLMLVAICEIEIDEEITIDYRNARKEAINLDEELGICQPE